MSSAIAEKTDRKVRVHATVNYTGIVLVGAKHSGSEIKETAILAGVAIDQSFVLSLENKRGKWRIIGDNETIKVSEGANFKAVASDDNS